jgi:transcriptional regulator with XRE-family HTH domain
MREAVEAKDATSAFERFTGWVAERIRKMQQTSELDHMPVEEVARLARDLGVSEGDLERLERGSDDEALLLMRRLAVLGIDAKELAAAGYMRDLQRTCALCDCKEICVHDLEARPESDEWQSYCPNSDILTAIPRKPA